MTETFRVAGWASIAVDAEVEAESIEDVGETQAREALKNSIEEMDRDILVDALLSDVEHTVTEPS